MRSSSVVAVVSCYCFIIVAVVFVLGLGAFVYVVSSVVLPIFSKPFIWDLMRAAKRIATWPMRGGTAHLNPILHDKMLVVIRFHPFGKIALTTGRHSFILQGRERYWYSYQPKIISNRNIFIASKPSEWNSYREVDPFSVSYIEIRTQILQLCIERQRIFICFSKV